MAFAQRIDRRVRYLSEALLAIIPKRTPHRGEKCGRRIVAHAPDRFFGIERQRLEKQAKLILAPTECRGDFARLGGQRHGDGHALQARAAAWFRTTIRYGQFLRKIALTKNFFLRSIDEQHFARPEALPLDHFLGIEIDEACFGTHDDESIRSHGIPQRAQAVAVEFCAHDSPIAENQGGWAVPRLLLKRFAAQKPAQLRSEIAIGFPCRRYHPQHRRGNVVSAVHGNFERVVEARRIADAFFERVKKAPKPEFLANGFFSCKRPAAIRADGIDLAIVCDMPEGLRHRPTRLRVCGIALMENREARREFGVREIGIKLAELPGRQQPFINYGAG